MSRSATEGFHELVPNAPAPLACAYGGGGLFGIAYLLGVGEALVDGGVALGAAPAIGTSAGSWAAGALALGVRWHDAIDLIGDDIPRVPDPRSGRLKRQRYSSCIGRKGETWKALTVRKAGLSGAPRFSVIGRT